MNILTCLFAAATLTLTPANTEVMIAKDAPPTVRFAAEEMTNFLSRVFGAAVPVREAKKIGVENRGTKDGLISIVLGDNEWSRAAGIDVAKLPRDGFVIKTFSGALGDRPLPGGAPGGRPLPSDPSSADNPTIQHSSCIFIAGRDDARADPADMVRSGHHHLTATFEHATLFGVYEFLERFADCRFFFPGKFGEVTPRQASIAVPETDLTRAPFFLSRNPYIGGAGVWFEDEGMKGYSRGKTLSNLRLRCDSQSIPCGHGQCFFMIRERFAKTHPEYFQQRKDGTRCTGYPKPGEAAWDFEQLCQSSKVWDEFYEDAKAYLSGKSAETRGMTNYWDHKKCGWNRNFVAGRYVDVMCQDAFHECFCPTCQAAYDKSSKQYARDVVWGQTAKLARRLKADGFDAIVTQMAYPPYAEIPKFDLPDNILVSVAEGGPWCVRNRKAFDAQIASFRGWKEKTRRRVLTWTYPMKLGPTAIPGVPCVAPRAFGEYWKAAAPYVTGSFLETEGDRAIDHLFNMYVFSKIAWDPDVDVEALIADHHAKMFGKGAAEMTRFYETLEDAWIGEIAGHVEDTIYGPKAIVPSEYEIWTRVYSPEKLARLGACCDRARAAATGDEMAQRRIAFIRAQYLDPLAKRVRTYEDEHSVARELARRKAHPEEVNLVDNGDLSQTNRWGQSANWSVYPQPKSLDPKVCVSAPYSLYVSTTNRQYAGCHIGEAKLKPGRLYRFSYFLKLKDVKKLGGGGSGVHLAFICGGREVRVPGNGNGIAGTMDWSHYSGLFRMPENPTKEYRDGLLCLRVCDASGTVWLDDMLVTEVPEGKKE